MAPFNSRSKSAAKKYFFFALFLLSVTLIFGLIGALQYLFPGLMKAQLSFEKVRPIHVTSAVFWIIFTAIATVYSYVSETSKSQISIKLMNIQFYMLASTIIIILVTYILGIFGGREYWEFHPLLAIPVGLSWLIFIYNVFSAHFRSQKKPVYIWMWLTGAAFFLFTFIESYLWLIPFFRTNIVTDMTVQWKSYGSMVGCWNMLIYGSSIYLMDKISGTTDYSHSKTGFLLYFLGLFNLMFNWGHHIYTLPTPHYVQYISYAVSMTELLLLGRIIYLWRASVSTAKKNFHIYSYRFLLSADLWIFLTLLLAILMSIPAINVYTHGTHITVAHTMGATIGINTFLLLAFIFDVFKIKEKISATRLNFAFILANTSLFIFWVALISAGVLKAHWQMTENSQSFSEMMQQLRPAFIIFFVGGIGLATAFFMIINKIIKSVSRR